MPRSPLPKLAILLPLAWALAARPVDAQLAHEGPAKAIALSQTLQPYDIVSIKPNDTSDPAHSSYGISIHDDVLRATNVRLIDLIEFAYDLKRDLISGLNGSVTDRHFDVEAKVLPSGDGPPPKLTDTQLQAMLIPMFADRFHLKAHLETKTLPVYDLIVAKGGPKIHLKQGNLTGNGWNINSSGYTLILTSKSMRMADLANMLSGPTHRQVIDKTGFTGYADITLKWTPDDVVPPNGEDTLSIFTAVEEQLGLKLQPSRGPVETLVIDHAEMPTEN